MKRSAVFGVLATVLVIGVVLFMQQPEQSAPAEAVADAVAIVAQPTGQTAAAETDESAQPKMVEESAANDAEEQVQSRPLLLAQADIPAGDWKYKEGTHFVRMVPTQPTVGGADKIEVAEFFWYGCNHCYDFEPYVIRWLEKKPANVRFVRIPAVWNPLVKSHAQLYYTAEVLVNNEKIANPEQFHAAVFARRGSRMATESDVQKIFETHGVSAEDFQTTWSSFEVAQKLRVAQDLARRYTITSVPAVVVNGKYRTGAGEAGGYPALMNLIDELIAREEVR